MLKNQVIVLPHELFMLNEIRELNFYRNLISVIPPDIKFLRHLQNLNLGSNKLTTIPVELGQLMALEELDLNNNKITTIPVDLCRCKALKDVKLFRNEISELPGEIGQLENLTKFDCSHNLITAIPPSLSLCERLVVLNVDNNPISLPPITVVRRGKAAIFKFLKESYIAPDVKFAISSKSLNAIIAGLPCAQDFAFTIEPTVRSGNEFGQKFEATLLLKNKVIVEGKVIENPGEGSYTGTIQIPKAIDNYELSIMNNNEQIEGCPVTILVKPADVAPENCVVRGTGLASCSIRREASFVINALDKFGNVIDDLISPFTVQILKVSDLITSASVKYKSPGIYAVSYKIDKEVETPLKIVIVVTATDENIKGSPFNLDVMPDQEIKKVEVEDMKSKIHEKKQMRNEIIQNNKKLEEEVLALRKKLEQQADLAKIQVLEEHTKMMEGETNQLKKTT